MLRLLCLLLLAAPAVSGEPAKTERLAESFVDELSAIREQVGGSAGSFVADREGFAEAVRGVVQNAPQPTRRFSLPEARRPDSRLVPVPREQQLAEPFEGDRRDFFERGFFHQREQHTPAVRLRLKAFELDRMAHDLEMADLGAEADAIREAAQTLRASARELVKAEKAAPNQPSGLGD